VAVVQELGDDRQVVVAEAVAVLPPVAIFEAPDDDDVVDGAFGSDVPPDGRLDTAVADGVNGPVISGLRRDGVPLSLRVCARHWNLLSVRGQRANR